MTLSLSEFLLEQQDYAGYLLLFCCILLFSRIGWRYFIRRLDRFKMFSSSLESRWHRIAWPSVLVLVPLLGWFATDWGSRRFDARMRNDLLKRVEMAMVSIPVGELQKLSGTAEDQGTPPHRLLVNRLANLKLAAPDVRHVYIMGCRNNQVFFYADVEPPESANYSPPGSIYKEAKPEFLAAFKAGRGIVEGPLQDSYGVWVSGSFPLRDPRSGAVIGMLGMDIDAAEWDAILRYYRKIFIGLTFLVSLVILFLYYMSQWFSVTANRIAVSERRHRDLAALQRAMLDSMDYAIVAVSNDGLIQMFNSGAERMFGYPAAAAIGKMTLAHFHQRGEGTTLPGPQFAQHLGPAICDFLRRQEQIYEREWTFVRQDNSRLPVRLTISSLCRDDGTVSGYLCIASDITEYKQTDDLLRTLKSSVQQAVESIIVTTAQLEQPGPQILFVNAGFSRMSGYDPEEIIGKTPRMFQGPATRREVLDHLKRNLTVGMPFLGETVNYRKDGTPYEIELRISPVRNNKGVVTNFVAVQNDISARRRAERDLQHRDRLLSGVSAAGHHLLAGVTSESILKALETLGKAAMVDRVYIFENHENPVTGDLLMSQRYEWAGPTVASQIDNPDLQELNYAPLFLDWKEAMGVGKPVYSLTRQFSGERRRILEAQDILSLLEVPIIIDGRFWGFIGFDDCHEERIWTSTEIGTLMAFVDGIGNAIIRMRTEAKLASARQREVMVAAKIQQMLLVTPQLTLLPWIDMAAVSIASQEVDGDFYDFFVHGAHGLDVVIGDVMGKGIPAALLGAATKSAIGRTIADRALFESGHHLLSPEEIMAQTDSLMTANMTEVDSFVTAFYARIDNQNHRLTWVDMGHTRTLVYRHATGTCDWLKGNGLPLGIGLVKPCREETVPFAANDILVLYSDGITEAPNEEGELFGEARLAATVCGNSHCESQALLERILSSVRDFARSGTVHDDRTCVIIRTKDAGKVKLPGTANIELTSDLNSLQRVREFVRNFCRHHTAMTVPAEVVDRLELACTEIASNLMRHTFRREPYHRICFTAEMVAQDVVFRFFHWGDFFEPAAISAPDLSDFPEGGFGLFLVKQSVDTLTFSQDPGGRCCTDLRLCLRKPESAGDEQNP